MWASTLHVRHATWPTTRERPIQITGPLVSRSSATLAIQPQAGRPRRLTTPPYSRSQAGIRRSRARVATSAADTPARPPSVTPAIRRPTTGPPTLATRAAGFPTTCQTCHTTAGWTGATFNHTYFPVPHNSARLCSDCHTNASNYTVFVCTSCHTKTSTDSHHRNRQGYVWNSANCYSCHPRGRAD